jgi:type III restriction enzyme
VDEFNAHSELYINLRDLRQYPEVKQEAGSLFKDREITVFIYRSDNLSDEHKERIIDFRNYDDNGRWFIMLDEAHKGDKEESKRQHIYSILSRNGFLFNFSATFTDERDIRTTAFDFNLARFIESGYGKHITVLKQENRAFKDKEDFTNAEKQRMVLKTLLLLTYVRRTYDKLLESAGRVVYHRPLLLTLVHSVNTADADLKLFFRELERIGKGETHHATWQAAKDELWEEFDQGLQLMYEGELLYADYALFQALELQDILQAVFNADSPGDIEVWVRPTNRQELAFKLKNAERPFALIKIGDISHWLKEELEGYDILEGFEDEGFFQRLNEPDSDINILMGSRSFYEGWDSNRPNVITFINIGMGTDARKFILQAIGRGVRIEPFAGTRKRMRSLYNAGDEHAKHLCPLIKDLVLPLETLCIFGTNRQALHSVISELELASGREETHEIALELNYQAIEDRPLLIPTYREVDHTMIEEKHARKFPITGNELDLLTRYVDYLNDDRLLVALHGVTPWQVRLLARCLETPEEYFSSRSARPYGRVDLAISRFFSYSQIAPMEMDRLKLLEDEINHFRHIKVVLEDIASCQAKVKELENAIGRVQLHPYLKELDKELQVKLEKNEIDLAEYTRRIRETGNIKPTEAFPTDNGVLQIKHIANHYYVPLILSESERIGYVRNIIRHKSEVSFVRDLEEILSNPDSDFNDLDWWLFSKIDENLDMIQIPYYDPNAGYYRKFSPDFVFWLQKGNDYSIVFVDPKGTTYSDYQHKVDGYRMIFENAQGKPRVIPYNGLDVRVRLLLYTEDASLLAKGYQHYWIDTPNKIAQVNK